MSRKIKTHARENASAVRRSPETSAQAAREPMRQATPAQDFTQALTATPQALAPTDILALQQSVGNRAVQQLLGAMLSQTGHPLTIQAKLKLGAAGDQYEQEADRLAALAMRAPALARQPVVQREMKEKEGEHLQVKPLSEAIMPPVQGEATMDYGDLQMKQPVNHAASASPTAIEPGVEAAIGRVRGGGQPLPVNVRAPFERALGADFSSVRVHTNAESDKLNGLLQARAFTTGHDLFFKRGEYSPTDRRGQELIAHELTHVIQQMGGRVSKQASPRQKSQPGQPILQRKLIEYQPEEKTKDWEEMEAIKDEKEKTDKKEGLKKAMERLRTVADKDIDKHVQDGHTLVKGLIEDLDSKKILLDDVEKKVKTFSSENHSKNFRNQLLNRAEQKRNTAATIAGKIIEEYTNDKVKKSGAAKTQVRLKNALPDYAIEDKTSGYTGLVDATSDASKGLPHITSKAGGNLLRYIGYPYVADSVYPELKIGKGKKVALGEKDEIRLEDLQERADRSAERLKQRRASFRPTTQQQSIKEGMKQEMEKGRKASRATLLEKKRKAQADKMNKAQVDKMDKEEDDKKTND